MAKKDKKTGVLNAAELRGKSADELKASLIELKKEQFNLRFQKKTGELKALARIKEVRRNVAKIKTVLNENAQKQNTKEAS